MRVARNRASWTSVAPVGRRSGVTAKRRSAFAAVFLSLRRHDPDQVRRVAALRLSSNRRRLSPLAGHPLDKAIIRRVSPWRQAPVMAGLDPVIPLPDTGRPVPGSVDHRVEPGDDDYGQKHRRQTCRVVSMVGRLIGWIIFLSGTAVLVRDGLVWIDTKHWAPLALGQLWYELNRSSLNLVQAVTQRYIHPYLWD